MAASGNDAVGLAEVPDLADTTELDTEVDPADADLSEDALEGADLEDIDLADVAEVEVDLDVDVEADDEATDEDTADEEAEDGPAAAGAATVAAEAGVAAPAAVAGAAPDAVAKPPGTAEEEAFVYGDDDDDLPAAQVASAGATADPVKDYLKQIGKVPLLNAEQEVELAKRIEAGLFAEEKLAEGMDMD